MIAGLPYDAEVEWLQGTYSGYIDTGIKSTRSISADVSFSILNPVQSERGGMGILLYGLGTSWDFQSYAVYFQNTANQPDIGKMSAHGNYIELYTPNGNHDYRLVATADGTATVKMSLYVDGQLSVTDKSVGISNVNGSRNFTLMWNRNLRDGDDSWVKTRISSAKLMENGVALFDAIPVRFTNELGNSEGAMYDRVSRKLFRNQGTGSFVTGPDVAVPVMGLHFMRRPRYTAKDYVQDGLVAMWDGIENAGWGVHDSDAGTNGLVNLVDSSVSLQYRLVDEAVIADNYFSVSPSPSAPNFTNWLRASVAYDPITIESVVEVPSRPFYNQRYLVARSGSSGQAFCLGFSMAPESNKDDNIYVPLKYWGVYGSIVVQPGVNSISVRDGSGAVNGVVAPIVNAPFTTMVSWGTNYSADSTNLLSGDAAYSSSYNKKMYCTRFYNRALTAPEIAHNYAVDKERFNLP